MWVFSKDGFFSAVQKGCDHDEVLVRSRQRSDLLRLGKRLGLKVKIETDAGTDYRYRAVMKKTDWAKYLAEAAQQLDYENFKDTIPKGDVARKDAYFRCWEAMLDWQEMKRPPVRVRRR